jgi:hypothetical protein
MPEEHEGAPRLIEAGFHGTKDHADYRREVERIYVGMAAPDDVSALRRPN